MGIENPTTVFYTQAINESIHIHSCELISAVHFVKYRNTINGKSTCYNHYWEF